MSRLARGRGTRPRGDGENRGRVSTAAVPELHHIELGSSGRIDCWEASGTTSPCVVWGSCYRRHLDGAGPQSTTPRDLAGHGAHPGFDSIRGSTRCSVTTSVPTARPCCRVSTSVQLRRRRPRRQGRFRRSTRLRRSRRRSVRSLRSRRNRRRSGAANGGSPLWLSCFF